MRLFGFKGLFEKRLVIYGAVLSVISVVITAFTCHFVSYRVILNQFEYVNRIATSAAAEKTNTYLGEIANIINLSMKSTYFNTIIDSDSLSPNQIVSVQQNYTAYLRDMILYNDKIDALLVVKEDTNVFVSAANSVGKEYAKYRLSEFYSSIRKYSQENPTSQFFLDKYEERDYERMAIVCPVLEPYGSRVQACIIAVLSQKLSQDLSSSGNQIILTDNIGNSAILVDITNDKLSNNRFIYSDSLNFTGWTISNIYSFEKIYKTILENLIYNFYIGIACFLLSLILLFVTGRKLVAPVKQMEEQIKLLNHTDIENRPISFKSRKISLRKSMFLLYSIMVTVPVILITGNSYICSKNIVESKIGSVFGYSAESLYKQLDFIFHNYDSTAIEISTVNQTIQSYMRDLTSPDVGEQMQNELNQVILSNNLLGRKIANISVYDTSYRLICSSTYGHPFTTRPDNKKDLDYISENFGSQLWRSYPDMYFNLSCFRVGMQIRDVSSNAGAGKLLGYILIDYQADNIQTMLNSFLQYSNVQAGLIDSSGLVTMKTGMESNLDSLLKQGKIDLSKGNGRDSFSSDGINYLAVFMEFANNGWKLIFLLKNFNESRQILYYSIAVLFGLLLLSFGFSYGFSRILSINILKLVKTVRHVKAGELGVRFYSRTMDEISELGNSFNEMLDRLNQLIEEKYISEVRAKDAELKMKEYELNLLQAQINPHFLYNTLKTAQYMVYSKDKHAEQMIKLLIKLFKTGVSKGEKLVSVREEIEHIRTYIDIQQMRFSNKFKVNYVIDDSVMDLKILKLTLQPIVENAIYHGLEMAEEEGIIEITGEMNEDRLVFVIRDNGLGITEEKLKEIKEQLKGLKAGRSIGLLNVHERIRLYFGINYGLDIESKIGYGTTVRVLLPNLTEETVQMVKKTNNKLY
ncbi:MAG: sensor histidine kinase [Clostridiaceae bacterium]|nr:sensor histidine kinase [Clostridiaceae bacterium]